MGSFLFTAGQYLRHLAIAKHRKGHGIHSPAIFEFVSEVVFDKTFYPDYARINTIRQQLLEMNIELQVQDAGEASRKFKSPGRKVSELVKTSSVQPKYGELLYRIVKHFTPVTIVELGTSIGLSTLCMALANAATEVISIEAITSLARFAQNLARNNQLGNVRILQGKFEDILPGLTQQYNTPQLAFIDGNHNGKATLRYFEYFTYHMDGKGILIFDDINWSKDMHVAWKQIASHKRSVVSIDLFQFGIVFLDTSITPGHYKVRY